MRRAIIISTIVAVSMPGVAGAAKFHIEEATIDSIQSSILKGELTSTEVVKQYLARIKAYDGPCVSQPDGILGPFTTIKHAGQINSLITVNLRPAARAQYGFDRRKGRSLTDEVDTNPAMPDALEVAAKQDAHFKATGKLVGPLHGITFAIKDWYDTFDMRTTAGADAAYANDRPPRDAEFIKRMRDAGAIILAKANVGSGISRSPFGGISCNPYDTERSAGTSSSGSGTSVAANLVTCAIAEETGGSILHPTKNNAVVGLAPTQELVSRDGMYGAGYNTRTGPICRTVKDAATVLDVIAGYDPKDELTVFSVGRMPSSPYASFAGQTRLDGIRIGVVREYMDRSLFNDADEESIAAAERAIADLQKLGATIVDPGPKGALLQKYIDKYAPSVLNKLFIDRFPTAFPVDANGKPTKDHIATLVDMYYDSSLTPSGVTLRSLGQGGQSVGESRFMLERYLRERGDASIKTLKDLNDHSKPLTDTRLDSGSNARGGGGENNRSAMTLDNADRWLLRFAVQQIVLLAMEDMKLDAMITPTGNIPPYILGRPLEPTLNGRGPSIWSFLGTQGFPQLGLPAGFTTKVYDRVRDNSAPGGSRLTEPTPAKLPLSVMFFGRPFGEPVLFRIASAYEQATHHREPPPDFGPLK
jgi:Asp-tRNA(Asn)/Glu-tRNA(Gln) amidotransferase A subunit family amidase